MSTKYVVISKKAMDDPKEENIFVSNPKRDYSWNLSHMPYIFTALSDAVDYCQRYDPKGNTLVVKEFDYNKIREAIGERVW